MLMVASGAGLGITRLTGEWIPFGVFSAIALFAGIYMMQQIEKVEKDRDAWKERFEKLSGKEGEA